MDLVFWSEKGVECTIREGEIHECIMTWDTHLWKNSGIFFNEDIFGPGDRDRCIYDVCTQVYQADIFEVQRGSAFFTRLTGTLMNRIKIVKRVLWWCRGSDKSKRGFFRDLYCAVKDDVPEYELLLQWRRGMENQGWWKKRKPCETTLLGITAWQYKE